MKLLRYACLPAVFALTLALAGCGDDQEKKDAENKKKVESQLAKIPGYRNATVAVKGDTLTITGFTADIPYEGMGVNRVSVQEIKAEGVDFEANTKPGVVPVAKKISAKNYRTSMDLPESAGLGGGGSYTGVVESMELAGMQLDMASLDKALSAEKPDMRELAMASMTFKADSSALKNYRIDLNMGFISGTMTMEKGTTGAFSLFGCKDMVLDNCKLTAMGAELFSMGKWTIKNAAIPDIFTPAMKLYGPNMALNTDPAASEAYGKDLAEALKKNPLLLQGMVLEDVKIRPMTNDPLSVKKVTVDFEFSQDRIIIKKDVEGFVVPPSVYGKGMEGALLSKLYGKPFELSGKVDMEAVKDGAGGRVAVNALNLTEKNLGACDFTFKGTFPKGDADVPAVPDDPDQMSLNNLSLTLKDKGILDLLFAIQAEETKAYDPSATKESVREQAIQGLTMLGGGGGVQQQVSDALVKFLKGSGTFSLSMSPTTPVTMPDLQQALNSAAENLNLKVSAE